METSFPLWDVGWRDEVWSRLDQEWDLIIIGGGITGAGLLNEAGRHGWKALLVEERDFAWGTSSRSSQLIHGGMRYIKQWKLGLTRSLILERDRLLDEIPGLVNPLPFILPTYSSRRIEKWLYGLGVTLYDLLRGKRRSWSWLSFREVQRLLPGVKEVDLQGGFKYLDAVTEDARMVLRVLREGVSKGGLALSYARADSLLREKGEVVGAEVRDLLGDRMVRLRARVVVNATGAGGDNLRGTLDRDPRLRPLRGAHLVIPRQRLPLDQAASFKHPEDGRHLYFLPWEGATLVGCTDLDHDDALKLEPRATEGEVRYLLEFVNRWLPGREIGPQDVVSTFAGIRPVVRTGRSETHNEARDSPFWDESGLVTLISGKLTGFRRVARTALHRLSRRLPLPPEVEPLQPFFSPGSGELAADLPDALARRLEGRYGPDAHCLVDAAAPGELESILGFPILWAELRWGARAEGVVHLDDLLLRRVRLGLLLPEGGKEILSRVRSICQEELGWSDERWGEEEVRYLEIIRANYGVPLPSQ